MDEKDISEIDNIRKHISILKTVYVFLVMFLPGLWLAYNACKTASSQINNGIIAAMTVSMILSPCMILCIGKSLWTVPAFLFLLLDGIVLLYAPSEEMYIFYGGFASFLARMSFVYLALTAFGIYLRIRIYLADMKEDEENKRNCSNLQQKK